MGYVCVCVRVCVCGRKHTMFEEVVGSILRTIIYKYWVTSTKRHP